MSKWKWLLGQLGKKLWVRVSLYGIAAVITATLALLFKNYIPEDISQKVGAEAVYSILNIIASSMLAVTIFSLSTMVAAHSAAAQNATPRATKLLLADRTTQNALGTFIGSFIYSLVGIVALTISIYGASGRLILFAVTILVIIIIIIVLIRWINYLSHLGQVSNTMSKVEDAAMEAVSTWKKLPCFGGTPMSSYNTSPAHLPVTHPEIGYVQYIDMQALNELAERCNIDIFVRAIPGDFSDSVTPIAYVSTTIKEEDYKKICESFHLGKDRSFEQDPRFGFIVLSQIGSRALSSGINDAGTAIEVISSGVKVMAEWIRETGHDDICYPRVHVPQIETEIFFNELFTPIARDGAGIIEVGIRLQEAFNSLAALGNEKTRAAARLHSELAIKRALLALHLDEDKEKITSMAL